MVKLTDWRWWAGRASDVDEDGVYDIAEGDTREAVVQAADRELHAGEAFYIIEARCWDTKAEPVDGIQRFARFKNRERLVVGARLEAAGAR